MNAPRGQSRAGARHDVGLRWLDHQICGPDDELLGNVDDLELVSDGSGWLVTGLMVGPAALSQRLPGGLGEWVYAVWRRLHPAAHPSAVVVPIEHVVAIDSAVHVDDAAAEALTSSFGLELWLREYVVSRLPGAGGPRADGSWGAAEARDGLGERRLLEPARGPSEGARGVSAVLGRPVRDSDGARVGKVSELVCTGQPRDERQVPLRVSTVLVTPHLTASRLGYSTERRQGPAAVRSFVRLWQRRDRAIDVQAVRELDVSEGDLRLAPSATTRHPHDLDGLGG